MRARRKVTWSSRRSRSALASCSGVMSTPTADPGARTHLHGGGEDVHARPTAEVEHALAGDEAGETQVVADARERAHRLGR